ncbi:MAG: SufD family Fe-S cluster assembly protein [bacterium]
MATYHLTFSKDLPATELDWNPDEETCEIEVPAGESHYIFQVEDDSSRHYVFHLRHPDSRLLLSGIVNAVGEWAPRLRTEVIHHAPATQAETDIRTVAYDNSQPHYEGLIRIEKPAQGSESYLSHHSLLLGEGSHSWTLPSLEILADQVKCSHAATVRTLNEEDLFYPRSRGISEATAEKMLIDAFANSYSQPVD